MSMLPVQPAQLGLGAGQEGQTLNGIPSPGAIQIPAIKGVATCQNLLSDAPPPVGFEYSIAAFAIGWGIIADGTAPVTATAELALLVGSDVRYVTSETENIVAISSTLWIASGAWVGDLTNPIVVGARDRLALRAGISLLQEATTSATVVVGAQVNQQQQATPYPSTITYDVRELPRRRRL